MEARLNVFLKVKSGKVYPKNTVFTEPFPKDIVPEIKAVKAGKSQSFTLIGDEARARAKAKAEEDVKAKAKAEEDARAKAKAEEDVKANDDSSGDAPDSKGKDKTK